MAYPERIIPDETEPGIVALHLKRYEFALPYCRGKDVLDAACGVGYGSARLAEEARLVVGIDVDADTIAYAQARYGDRAQFRVMDVGALDFADRSFDTVCSFETIEHVRDQERTVAEAARVLRPEGVYAVSTPNAPMTTHTPANPFHQVELDRGDFERLLRRFFGEVEVYGQRREQTRRHRLMQRLDVLGLRKRLSFLTPAAALLGTPTTTELTTDDVLIVKDDIERATELVALCRAPRTP